MAILDIHCHFFPQAFLDEARRPNTLQAKIERGEDGEEHLICAGNFDHPLTPDFYAVERMLADMDQAGIEMAAISSAPPTLSYWADPADARRLAPMLNNSIAERVAAHSDRFRGL